MSFLSMESAVLPSAVDAEFHVSALCQISDSPVFADIYVHLTSLCIYFKVIVQRLLLSVDALLCLHEVRAVMKY